MKSTTTTRRAFSSAGRTKCSLILGVVLSTAPVFGPMRVALSQTPEYVVTELTNEDGSQVPSKLNNLGDIVGRKADPGGGAPRAMLWGHSHSKAKHLGVFPRGDYSSADAINDAGEVAGVSNTSTAILPFLWSDKRGLQRMPLLAGDNCGAAVAINKHGHVVGYSSGKNGAKAFFWGRADRPLQLPTLPGGSYSKGRDLNDKDEIVGRSESFAGARAVLWTKSGSVRDLGTLPGDYVSEAVAINNSGDVVGYSKGPQGMRAFLWNQTSGMQELGVLPGGSSSRALAISNLGEVVGSSTSTSGDRAFIWTKEAGMVDLNNPSSANLGIILFEAHSINDKGQIIAMGKNSNEGNMGNMLASSEHEDCAPAPPASFLLTPTTAK